MAESEKLPVDLKVLLRTISAYELKKYRKAAENTGLTFAIKIISEDPYLAEIQVSKDMRLTEFWKEVKKYV